MAGLIVLRHLKSRQVTVEEVRMFFVSGKADSDVSDRAQAFSDTKLFHQFLAEDTVAYHDMNDDMIVSTRWTLVTNSDSNSGDVNISEFSQCCKVFYNLSRF